MALTIGLLTDIAKDTQDLLTEVNNLRNAGTDDKTDQLEAKAMRAIERVRKAVEESAGPGTGRKEDLEATFQEQLKAIEQRTREDRSLDTSAMAALLHDKAAITARLATVTFSGALTWNSLLDGDDLEAFRQTIASAAKEVRQRRKLARVVQSLFSAFRIGLGLAAKMAAL